MREEVYFDKVHAYHYAAKPQADYALLIAHGIGGHGGTYDKFCEPMAARGVEIFSMDLPGHGKARNENGIFRFTDWLEDLDTAARAIKARLPGRKVFAMGSSQGSMAAFHSLAFSDAIDGAVMMNLIWIPELLPPADTVQGGLLQEFNTPESARIAQEEGDKRRFDLNTLLDWNKNYARDEPGILEKKQKDPLRAWYYGYASLRSYYTYVPPIPSSANKKPVFVTCGEDDPLVPASYVAEAYKFLGGPKELAIVPHGTHQLMLYHTDEYVPMVDTWCRKHLG